MLKKEEIIKDAELLMLKIEESKSLSMKKIYYNELLNIIDFAEEIGLKLEYEVDNQIKNLVYKENISGLKLSFNDAIAYQSYYKDLSDNIIRNLETNEKIIKPKSIVHITEKERKDLIFDFITKYNPDLYPWIKDTYNRIIYFRDDLVDYGGLCYFLPLSNKSYIRIQGNQRSTSIRNLSYLSHELGHALHSKLIENQSSNVIYKMFYSKHIEVPSCTFEQLFLDYLIKQNIYSENALAFSLYVLKEIKYNMFDINIMSSLSDYDIDIEETIICSETELKNKIKEINKKYKSHIPLDFEVEFKSYSYGIGYLISLYFEEMFKENSKESRKIFENYIMNIGNMCDYDIFDNFGFSRDKLLTDDLVSKVLTKKYNEYNKISRGNL